MTLHDRLTIALGNLWRMKLRAFLTISGVVIAIAAFVSMLSFGAGNQQLVAEQFERLGLLSTIIVYPSSDDDADTADSAAALDIEMVATLSQIPGVNLAYPMESFSVGVQYGDTQVTTRAQALPGAALQTKLVSQLVRGEAFGDDSTDMVLVTEELLEILGVEEPDSLLGKQLIVSVSLTRLDSGLARVFMDEGGAIRERLRGVRFDSLLNRDFAERTARRELNEALRRFFDGFMSAREHIADTLEICGVVERRRGHGTRLEPVIIPLATARRFDAGGLTDDPVELLAAVRRGSFLIGGDRREQKNFPRVTLDLDPAAPYEPVRDSIKALGLEPFSYAEEFAEIRRVFLYFNLGLAMIGLIALSTASLGIINTLVMSIIERTREIGVLKSLGADERDIRMLFLVESAAIGIIGAAVGTIVGWLIARVASFVGRTIMEREGIDPVEALRNE